MSVQSTKRSSTSSGQVSARGQDEHKNVRLHPEYKKLQDVHFPPAIYALPHVLEMIDDLLLAPEEAIITAVKRKEQKWLNYLLEKFHRIVSDVLLQGATTGDEEIVEALLPSMYKPGTNELEDWARIELEEAVGVASQRGIYQLYVSYYPKLSRWRNAATSRGVTGNAAWNGYRDILAFAADIADAENGDEYKDVASHTLRGAINGNHPAAATFLVNRYYRDWDLKDALEMAIVRGQIEVADCIYEALLKKDYHTSLEEAFVYMASHSLVNALMYLYRRGHHDPRLVGRALINAARSAEIDMLTLLLDTGKVSTDVFNIALWYAARGGRMEIVAFLSSDKLASARSIAHAFESAGDVKVSRYLYEKLQNPAEAARAAFGNATFVGPRQIYTPMTNDNRIAVVKFLVSTGHVPTELITEAFMGGKHFEIVRALYDDQRISLDMKYDTFRGAAVAGRIQVLKFLAGNIFIPRPIKIKALKAAAQRPQLEALRILCEMENWSIEVLSEVSTVDSRARVILQAKLGRTSSFVPRHYFDEIPKPRL